MAEGDQGKSNIGVKKSEREVDSLFPSCTLLVVVVIVLVLVLLVVVVVILAIVVVVVVVIVIRRDKRGYILVVSPFRIPPSPSIIALSLIVPRDYQRTITLRNRSDRKVDRARREGRDGRSA